MIRSLSNPIFAAIRTAYGQGIGNTLVERVESANRETIKIVLRSLITSAV